MTTETEQINDLLRELVESFIDHAEALEVSAEEFPGAVYWELKGHADDYGKLVGKGGAHVNALTFLVAALGSAREQLFTFKLREPEPARRRPGSPPKQADAYDPRPARDLLCEILSNLALGDYVVEVAHNKPALPLAFTFSIAVRSEEDYRALTVSPEGSNGLTIVGALGTLFRAAANKVGVRFQIDVLRP